MRNLININLFMSIEAEPIYNYTQSILKYSYYEYNL